MTEPVAVDVVAAIRLIDSVTSIKNVLGAMIADDSGEIVAQDFVSPEVRGKAEPLAKGTLPALNSSVGGIQRRSKTFGVINEITLQFSGLLIRAIRRDQFYLLVFAKADTNLGMLNVDLKQRRDLLCELSGHTIVSDGDRERERLFDVLRSQGSADSLIAACADLESLRTFHGMVFQTALDLDIDRESLTSSLNQVNFRIYRDSLVNFGFDFFNRKTLDNYDPALARLVVSEQINCIVDHIKKVMP
jgi:predicted regulator of Ras-like GTPase activity (Roadblock/LC7/MglB family)